MNKIKMILALSLLAGGFMAMAGDPGMMLFSGKTSCNTNRQGMLVVEPLDPLYLTGAAGETVIVRDALNREYFSTQAGTLVTFTAAGAAGIHTVSAMDKKGRTTEIIRFQLKPVTSIKDSGKFEQLFTLLYRGMCVYNPEGYDSVVLKGKTYHYFVNWVLDNYETSKGMQYFQPYAWK